MQNRANLDLRNIIACLLFSSNLYTCTVRDSGNPALCVQFVASYCVYNLLHLGLLCFAFYVSLGLGEIPRDCMYNLLHLTDTYGA